MKRYKALVVIIMGPPGAGKGTQAELLTKTKNLVHFDTGRYLEELLYNPRLKKDKVIFSPRKNNFVFCENKIIREQRKLFESGKLVTPSWLLGRMIRKVKGFAKADLGIAISGSPRSIYEAFGDKSRKGLMKALEQSYGKKNIFIFVIKISENQSIKRNSARLICSVCERPLLKIENYKLKIGKRCPFCAGKLYKRILDKPEIIKKRLAEYKTQTLPVIKALKNKNYQYLEIDGNALPFKINKQINDSIEDSKRH